MLISHEVPLNILRESKRFNDYDYCLLHLLSKYPEYKQFYIDSIKQGRKVLLDNSLFELGDSLSAEQLITGIYEIKPTWYVVPDCWEDATTTKERFLSFERYIKDLPGIPIGVVQGDTWEALDDCYKFMCAHASKIAFPFGIKAYIDIYDRCMGASNFNEPVNEKLCEGRQFFINSLMNHNLWAWNKPHHLLGCIYAREFSNPNYKHPSIESCDTSNPIVAGLVGLSYGVDGLPIKPLIKMNDLMEVPVTKQQFDIIDYNVKSFRDIVEAKSSCFCNEKNI